MLFYAIVLRTSGNSSNNIKNTAAGSMQNKQHVDLNQKKQKSTHLTHVIRICIPSGWEKKKKNKALKTVRLHRAKAWENQISIKWMKSKSKKEKEWNGTKWINKKKMWKQTKKIEQINGLFFFWRRNEYSIYNLVTLSERHVILLVIFSSFFVVVGIFFFAFVWITTKKWRDGDRVWVSGPKKKTNGEEEEKIDENREENW